MKIRLNTIPSFFIFLLTITSCIETDIVEDEIVLIKITSIDKPETNGTMGGLVGEQISLSAEAFNDRGVSFQPDVTWMSSNKVVATVDNNGKVDLLASGTTNISAKGYGVTSNELTLNVVASSDEVSYIEISSPKNRIAIDEAVQLTAKAFDLNSNEVGNTSFSWSSLNTDIASVSAEGIATGTNNGTAVIQAKYENITGNFSLMVGESSSRTGSFTGLGGHDVQGSVTLSELNGGGLLLTIGNDFSTIDGPGLHIYLSNNTDNVNGGFEVGALKKNSGSDSYSIDDITLDQYDYVFIYCKPFGVPFGRAGLN